MSGWSTSCHCRLAALIEKERLWAALLHHVATGVNAGWGSVSLTFSFILFLTAVTRVIFPLNAADFLLKLSAATRYVFFTLEILIIVTSPRLHEPQIFISFCLSLSNSHWTLSPSRVGDEIGFSSIGNHAWPCFEHGCILESQMLSIMLYERDHLFVNNINKMTSFFMFHRTSLVCLDCSNSRNLLLFPVTCHFTL